MESIHLRTCKLRSLYIFNIDIYKQVIFIYRWSLEQVSLYSAVCDLNGSSLPLSSASWRGNGPAECAG